MIDWNDPARLGCMPVYCPFCGKYGKGIIVDCRAYDEEVIEYYKCEYCGKVHGM